MSEYPNPQHRLMAAALFVLLVQNVSAAAEYLDMSFHVTLEAKVDRQWIPYVGTIRAYMSWRGPSGRADRYVLYADGTQVATATHDYSGAQPIVAKQEFWRISEYDAWVEDYMNREHEYKVEFYPWAGQGPVLYDTFVYVPPNVLQIEDYVASLPAMGIHRFELRTSEFSSEGIDAADVLYSGNPSVVESKIVSVILDPASRSERELEVDTRPKNNAMELQLELSLVCPEGSIHFPAATTNELRFRLPGRGWGNDFALLPITIQRYDPAAPSVQYPIYDVRRLIAKNEGALRLPDLQGTYISGEPYAYLRLSFTQQCSIDLNLDGRVDLLDFATFANGWRDNGAASADIAGPKGLGIPDGLVNCRDLLVFCSEWCGYAEHFESGTFLELLWAQSGLAPWKITGSRSHSGQYCAQAGRIGDKGTTKLVINMDCALGRIRFWRKVSSEDYADYLQFRIDSTVQGRWSGEADWEEVSFPVPAGRHTFTWEYVKNGSVESGADTAWIDDILFPHR